MRRFTVWDLMIYAVLTFLFLVCVFPFYYVFIVSFANQYDIMRSNVYIFPMGFNIDAYLLIFSDGRLLRSAFISIFVTVVGTIFSMTLIIMAGYGLSKKEMPLRRFFMIMVLITLFFGGQLIPYFILIRDLGLINNIFVLIIPMSVNSFFLIIMKNYFLGIPISLEESARIDGANDVRILWQILVPVSKPILATLSLFTAVNYWNEWWHAMLFLNDTSLWPMQMMLREILADIASATVSPIGRTMAAQFATVNTLTARMAAIMVTTIPILLVYPFIQKHFAKGLMIGSLKE